ncbi:hypothetical protein LCGC14_0920790 [marine sediment metagenome]|uniref:Uncharacterized protein n=1 Tax=marine sediment metagenome TaxID=412755 RepID=A0A0F9RXJ7_9ZZZZ
MGLRYLRSIVSDFQTLTASTEITPIDLPVNPLSHLILTLALTKATAAIATGLGRLMLPIIDQITDLSIRHRGENIIQGRLLDLVIMNSMMTGIPPAVGESGQADNQVQFVSMVLSLSRMPYWHNEAFPATQRGNLRFHMTAGAISSLYDAAQWSLEAVELIEDEPTRFMKYTTQTRTIAATGRQRIPLPIGNEILGILCFDPANETDATISYAFGKVKLMKDNVEQYFAESNWESIRESTTRRLANYGGLWGHRHAFANPDTSGDTDTGEEQHVNADVPPLQYGYLDFDPLKDGSYSLETRGAASLDLDISADVAGNAVVRVMPLEMVPVPGAAPTP